LAFFPSPQTFPSLEGIAPDAGTIATPPDQAKIMVEPGRADPAFRIRVEAHILAIPKLVNVEAQIVSAGIHDPELGDAR
jgi:hypothetical protein